MSKTTAITHNGIPYEISIDGWHNHLDSKFETAVTAIHTDDIIIHDEIKAGEFKKRVREAYELLPEKQGLTLAQYRDKKIKEIYGHDWDACINYVKHKIHEGYLKSASKPDRSKKMTHEEQHHLLKAASNGHIAAMYFIGTALADQEENDNAAVMWLTMAHNRGQLGACYELSRYFDKLNNVIDSIRCLIVSADKGHDVAYMSIFHTEHLKKLAAYENKVEIGAMLDELLAARPHSSARFFKAALLLADGEDAKGIQLLRDIQKNPKNMVKDKNHDDVYQKQAKFTQAIIDQIFAAIADDDPLIAMFNACDRSKSTSYADYNEIIERFEAISRQ